MASNSDRGSSSASSSKDKAKRTGKTTEEYQRVKENMNKLIDAVDLNPGATGRLTNQFIEKKWIDTHVNSQVTATDLVKLVIHRIETDAGDYQVFLQMLEDITVTSLKHILTNLNGMYTLKPLYTVTWE